MHMALVKLGRPDAHVIEDPRQLQALASPLRQQLVWAMERIGRCSVAEVGHHVGVAPESLYYHMHKLTDVGLVAEVAKRRAGRRLESVYELVGKRVTVDPGQRSPEYLAALAAVGRSILRAAERAYGRAIERLAAPGSPPGPRPMLLQWSAQLSEESAAELRQRLVEIDDFLSAHDDPVAGHPYSITAVVSSRTCEDAAHRGQPDSGD